MRFQRLDLNLLVVLDALLTERSVSLAAERVCLSQSATSSALGRLREYFGDDLLVLKGRNMVLTARAESLVGPVRAVLEQIRSTIAVSPPFNPAESDRTLTLMASDYMTEVLLSSAMRDMAVLAPNMRFEITPMGDANDALERGAVDILLSIDYALSPDHPSQILFEDDFVVVGCADNPALQGEMTRELYFSLGHVTTRFGKTRVPVFDDWFTRRQSQPRRVEVVAPSFLTMASMVSGSRRIATMHRRLAQRVAASHGLRSWPVPFEIPPIRESAQWHIANNNDPAIRWVVERLAAVAAEKPMVEDEDNVVPIGAARQRNYLRDDLIQQFRAVSIPSKS